MIYIAIRQKATQSQQIYPRYVKIHSVTSQRDNDILTSDQHPATDLAWRYESILWSTIKFIPAPKNTSIKWVNSAVGSRDNRREPAFHE
jgi:hypothetical protein